MTTLDSDTLWYQSETEEATTHTEICLPQSLDASDSILRARISAAPIMLVRAPSDFELTRASPSRSPSSIPTHRSITDTTTSANAYSDDFYHQPLSNREIAAIAASLGVSVSLLIATCFCFWVWKRRSSNNKPQPQESPGINSSSSNPCGETKAEMEDPVSAGELFKQSGAYRGKPELGSEADKTHGANPIEVDRILLSSQDNVAENSSPGDRNSNTLGHAHPAELE